MPVLDEEEKENFKGPNALHSSQEKRFKFDSLLSLAIPTQACSSNGGENHHSSQVGGWLRNGLLEVGAQRGRREETPFSSRHPMQLLSLQTCLEN